MREILEELAKAETYLVPTEKLRPNPWNPNEMPEKAWNALGQSIVKYGIHLQPIVVRPRGGDDNFQIIDGEHRFKWAQEMGITSVSVVIVDVDDYDAKKLTQILNRTRGDDNPVKLKELLDSLLVDHAPEEVIEGMAIASKEELGYLLADLEREIMSDYGFEDEGTEGLTDDDEVPEDAPTRVKRGDIWQLGRHRLMCGDSTSEEDVKRLMDEEKSVLLHADPPYGMGKEKDGVKNDNLYQGKLDAFQMEWWRTFRSYLEDNASAYIWGNAEGLWRLWYCGGLKDSEKLTFRNQIIWDKNSGQGMQREQHRMFPTATEHCLFFMLGEQGFNNNADNYWDGWEPIRCYLAGEAKKIGLTPEDVKKICGVGMYSHWFTESQWTFIPEHHYKKLQAAASSKALNREYDDLKREYDALKREFYSTRAYFDNTHDNMTDVWNYKRVTGDDRHGHATPKPVKMIERIIKSSSPKNGLVIEPFLGSGTTLIAAEKTNRICYGMELSEKYCDVIIKRWEDFTGQTAQKVS